MVDKYEEIYARFKEFIESNSQYGAKVVKYNITPSTYFPVVSCAFSNITTTNDCTNYKIEYYENLYLTINIYTKDKKVTTGNQATMVASQVITNELIKLTMQFFEKLNMKRTLCRPIPNIDAGILRTVMQYQGEIGNARGNIIRR